MYEHAYASLSFYTKLLELTVPLSTDGYLSLHAVRRDSPQAGHTYFQGQITVNGYLVIRAG